MRSLGWVAALVVVGFASQIVEAKQYTKQVHGRSVVVHTNPIPVLLHRAVPPQHGRHITEREYRSGHVPQPGRFGSRVIP
jgi:hypothetical protein